MGVQHTRRVRAAPGASDPAAILMRGWLAPHPLPPAAGPANGASPPTPPRWGRPWPCSLTFLEACALPSSGGRSPEHVRGGCGAVRGTRSQALQQAAAPPSPASAPLRGRCHLVLAAERKRRDTLPRPRRLLLWLLSAGPVSLIFFPGIWVGTAWLWGEEL